MAGATLGGGTTVNWTNCLRTRPWVRDEWAAAGLDDVATGAFDAHLDAVWSRLGVTDACSEPNGVQRRMRDGARALGWAHSVATRNVDPGRYDPATGGHLGFGDRSGAKRSTLRTYLQDAHDAGARIVAGCTVDRVLVGPDGRAAGATGTWADRDDPGARRRRSRSGRRSSSSPPARWRRRPSCCARGSAARPRGRACTCTRPWPRSAATPRTSRPGGARRTRCSWTSSSPAPTRRASGSASRARSTPPGSSARPRRSRPRPPTRSRWSASAPAARSSGASGTAARAASPSTTPGRRSSPTH